MNEADPPKLKRRSLGEVEAATGVRQRVRTSSGVAPMTEEEFLLTRNRARVYRQIFLVLVLLQVCFFLFLTEGGVMQMKRTTQLIMAAVQVFCLKHVMKTRTRRYQDYLKAWELREYRGRKRM